MDEHAQFEIRAYASTMGEEIVRPLFPLVWEAFVDFRLEAVYLTRLDRGVIQRLLTRLADEGRCRLTEEDFLAAQDPSWREITRSRERDECRAKLIELGLIQ
jgi:thymidylate synthase (FAD)